MKGALATIALGGGVGAETPSDVGAIRSITNDLLLHCVRPLPAIQEFAPASTQLECFRIPPDIAHEASPITYGVALDMVHAVLYENGLTNTQVGTTHDPQSYARVERPGYLIEPWNAQNEADLPAHILGLLD